MMRFRDSLGTPLLRLGSFVVLLQILSPGVFPAYAHSQTGQNHTRTVSLLFENDGNWTVSCFCILSGEMTINSCYLPCRSSLIVEIRRRS